MAEGSTVNEDAEEDIGRAVRVMFDDEESKMESKKICFSSSWRPTLVFIISYVQVWAKLSYTKLLFF